VRWLILIVGLEFPATLSLVDCINRSDEEFAGGTADRKGWLRWLVVAVLTSVVGIGYGIVLGYYWAVVKRNNPARP
jgi:hypothetical protein